VAVVSGSRGGDLGLAPWQDVAASGGCRMRRWFARGVGVASVRSGSAARASGEMPHARTGRERMWAVGSGQCVKRKKGGTPSRTYWAKKGGRKKAQVVTLAVFNCMQQPVLADVDGWEGQNV